MCSTPKISTPPVVPSEPVATPTMADSKVTKAAANQRNKAAANFGRDVRTSASGDNSQASTSKKKLLGE